MRHRFPWFLPFSLSPRTNDQEAVASMVALGLAGAGIAVLVTAPSPIGDARLFGGYGMVMLGMTILGTKGITREDLADALEEIARRIRGKS